MLALLRGSRTQLQSDTMLRVNVVVIPSATLSADAPLLTSFFVVTIGWRFCVFG